MKVVILAGGEGSRIWPYNEIRNKAVIPVGNRPLIQQTVEALKELKVTEILIIGSYRMEALQHLFFSDKQVKIIETGLTGGSARTLLTAEAEISADFLLLFGDCYVQKSDLQKVLASKVNTVLCDKTKRPKDQIIALVEDSKVKEFVGHPRSLEEGQLLFALHLDKEIFPYLHSNQGRLENTKVGVGSPNESFLEESLNQYLKTHDLRVVESEYRCFDINKPWDILAANAYHNQLECTAIEETKLGKGASIDESAVLMGKLVLGDNSRIGRNVVIQGNCIIGDNTVVDNGAIIGSNVRIGNDCIIQNYCKIADNSTIGNKCIVEHTAELLGGMLMDKVYLYHYGEFFGLCGEKTDLGAGSVCGTLRFDDGEAMHKVKGRRETPQYYANATYLGDYVRTGVNVIFQPGVKVGTNSVIGSGIVLNRDVANGRILFLKQEIEEKEWGNERYGW